MRELISDWRFLVATRGTGTVWVVSCREQEKNASPVRIAPAHRCVPSSPMDAATSPVASGKQRLMAKIDHDLSPLGGAQARPPDCYPSPIISLPPLELEQER